MEKWIYRIIIAALALSGLGYFIFWSTVPGDSDANFQSRAVPAELAGKVFHWRYDNGWDFRVEMQPEALYWEGMAKSFEGMKAKVHPQYTKIDDGMYFLTWEIPMIGLDSLVINFPDRKVYAHSKANAKFYSVVGEIYCSGLEETCEKPQR